MQTHFTQSLVSLACSFFVVKDEYCQLLIIFMFNIYLNLYSYSFSRGEKGGGMRNYELKNIPSNVKKTHKGEAMQDLREWISSLQGIRCISV